MPLYECKCRACDHNWEERREWKAPMPACPSCAADDVRKVFHAAAIVFKGSGWHVNDYSSTGRRGAGSKPSEAAESAAAASSDSSSSSDSSASSASSAPKSDSVATSAD